MKSISITRIGVALFFVSLAIPFLGTAQGDSGPFADVPESSAYAVPLKYLKEKNLVAGFSDGLFHPEREVNRAEALAMIYKATGLGDGISGGSTAASSRQAVSPEHPIKISLPRKTEITVHDLVTGETRIIPDIRNIRIDANSGEATIEMSSKLEEKPFLDVFSKDWFFEIVQDAKQRGIVSGVGGTEYFKPDHPVTLVAGLRMLLKAGGVTSDMTTAPIPDSIAADAWYAKDIAYALDRTLLTSKQGNFWAPDHSLTRGELALLLYRYMRISEGFEFGYASWYGDGLAKTNITNGIEFKERNLTAAHRTLPFGTIVRVTNMDNGKYVDVVINDRGPFVTGRVVDLSRTAFSELEATSVGVISVQMEVKKF